MINLPLMNWIARGVPSPTAIRNDDDRDSTSKPSDACAAAGDPSRGQGPNRERPNLECPSRERRPNRARSLVPIAIRIGDDRDPTSKPSGACAVPADPSPGQLPSRAPNREQAAVPTTGLEPQGQTVCRLDPDQVGPASLPQSQ